MNTPDRAIKILANIVEYDPEDIKPEMRLAEDLGFDSLDRETLAGDLEHYLGVEIPMDAETEWVTVQDVINTLLTHQ